MNKGNSDSYHFIVGGKKEFFSRLKKVLNFRPGNRSLYELAFIHKSASIILPDGSMVNNERLEFLGDAILDAVVSDYLFKQYTKEDEGFLTKIRSRIVNRDNLNVLAERIGINHLLISKVKQNDTGKNLYGNAFEAFIGAIYLDCGYKRTKKYLINNVIHKHLDIDEILKTEIDFKSQIIEWTQKNRKSIDFTSSEKFDDDKKTMQFLVHLLIDDQEYGTGSGNSKKEAEQNASEQGLQRIKNLHG